MSVAELESGQSRLKTIEQEHPKSRTHTSPQLVNQSNLLSLSAKIRLVDPALVVDAVLLELFERVVQPVVEPGRLSALELADEDVLEATVMRISPIKTSLGKL